MSVVQHINSLLRKIGKPDGVPMPDKSDVGKLLFKAFVWQEIERIAKTELEHAWKEIQAPKTGVCDDDDTLRALIVGEKEVANSRSFSLVVKVAEPGSRLDMDAFIADIARQWKKPVSFVEAITLDHKTKNKAALTKRVVERV